MATAAERIEYYSRELAVLRDENIRLRAALEAVIDRLKAVAEWNRFPSLEEAIEIASRELKE